MKSHIIIPARYGSTRLANKLLLDLAGKSVLQHTYEKAIAADIGPVFIATDDERIEATAKAFGATVVMTKSSHQSGTERIAEVVDLLSIPPEDIVINLQGDVPLIAPHLLIVLRDALMAAPTVSMATLAKPIWDISEIFNPHVVKVMMNAKGQAVYFSRAPIPFFRDGFSLSPPQLPGGQVSGAAPLLPSSGVRYQVQPRYSGVAGQQSIKEKGEELPAAFSFETRRECSGAAECIQTYMSSDTSSQQSIKEKGEGHSYYAHVGVYAYRPPFIKEYVSLPISPWESIESLEQLRVLWHGGVIQVAIVDETAGIDVNTLEDLIKARGLCSER